PPAGEDRGAAAEGVVVSDDGKRPRGSKAADGASKGQPRRRRVSPDAAAGRSRRAKTGPGASRPTMSEPPTDPWRNLRHELLTPIGHIVNGSETVVEELEDRATPALLTLLDDVHTAGRQAEALVRELLDPSRATASPDLLQKQNALGILLDCVSDRIA